MLRFVGVSGLSLAAMLATPAYAGEYVELAGDQCEECRTIIVTGSSSGYVAQDIVTATKTDTPILDVPQTIHVVTREQLDDQAQYSLGEVLRYVPGTTVGQEGAIVTRSRCAGKTPPQTSSSMACAMTCNIIAGFIMWSVSRSSKAPMR